MKCAFWMGALAAFSSFVLFSSVIVAEPAQAVGTVTGTVARDGKPVANVKVSLRSADKRDKSESPTAAPAPDDPATQPAAGAKGHEKHPSVGSTVTDADGKFTLGDVPPGEYVLVASDKHLGKGRSHVTISAGDSTNIAIDLQPPKPKDKTKKANKLGL